MRKESIGQIIEDRKKNSKLKFSASDNPAYIETLLNNDEKFNQIFHISEQPNSQFLHENNQSELPNSKLKKKTKKIKAERIRLHQ